MESQIQSLANATIQRMETDGAIQKIIEKHITESIEDAVKDALGRWSPFNKDLEKHLKENVLFKADNVSLPVYNEYIKNALEAGLHKVLGEQAGKVVESLIRDNFEIKPQKGEYYLDEFLKQIVKAEGNIDSDDVSWDPSPYLMTSLHIETNSVLTFIYFDTKKGKERYECSYRFSINPETEEIHSLDIRFGKEDKIANEFLLSCKYSGVKLKGLSSQDDEEYSLNVEGLVDYCAC